MKTNENEIVLTCYRNAVTNANTSIGHNIVFLGNTFRNDIVNNEITQFYIMHQYYRSCLVIELLLLQIHPNILLINVFTLTSELLVPPPDRILSATL